MIITLVISDAMFQAIPRITNEFHSLEDIGWYGSAYTIGRYDIMHDFYQRARINYFHSAALQTLNGKLFQHFKLKVGLSNQIH